MEPAPVRLRQRPVLPAQDHAAALLGAATRRPPRPTVHRSGLVWACGCGHGGARVPPGEPDVRPERGAAGRRAGCYGCDPHPAKPLLRLRRTARAVLRRGALRDARRVQDGQPKTLGARRPARWPWYGHQGQPSTYIPGIRSSARDVRVWHGPSEGRERGGTGRERVPGPVADSRDRASNGPRRIARDVHGRRAVRVPGLAALHLQRRRAVGDGAPHPRLRIYPPVRRYAGLLVPGAAACNVGPRLAAGGCRVGRGYSTRP